MEYYGRCNWKIKEKLTHCPRKLAINKVYLN